MLIFVNTFIPPALQSMRQNPTELLMVSKPSLMSSSLLSYFNAINQTKFHSVVLEPQEFLSHLEQFCPDVLVIYEENNALEVDQMLSAVDAFTSRLIVIVGNTDRQREVQQKTGALVLVWGFFSQAELLDWIYSDHTF
jgi:chemotaxis response regulator CheB